MSMETDNKEEKQGTGTPSPAQDTKQAILPKKKKNNRKLLLQIGVVTALYSLIAFAVIVFVFYGVCIMIYTHVKEEQLQENLKRVDETILESDREQDMSGISGGVLDALEQNPDMMAQVVLGDDFFLEMQDEDWDTLDEYLERTGSRKAAMATENLETLPPRCRNYLVGDSYWYMFYQLAAEQGAYGYENLSVIDITEGHEGMILYDADASDSVSIDRFSLDKEWRTSFVEESRLGEQWEDTELMYDIIWESSGEEDFYFDVKDGTEDGEEYEGNETVIGYMPIKVDGEERLMLVIAYRWADFQDTMQSYAQLSVAIMLPLIIISEALLLLYIYFKSVRPLRIEKEALAKYVETKDSEAVVRAMKKIKERNEFGALSEDISTLVQEIDRYMKENVHLAAEKEKVATELELAAKIQSGMLRRDFPETPEYEIYALMDPAKEVGGDFYDFFEVDATHLALVIGDVSGKGVPGSLFMMKAQTVIRDKTLAGGSPAEIMAVVNDKLVEGDFDEMFVTIWLGILDLETGVITAVNAGHEYPVLKTGENFELLEDPHGFVAGGMEGMKYKDYEIDLGNEGMIFVYTDGVPEATRGDMEMYGTEQLVSRLNREEDPTPRNLVDGVARDVNTFVGNAEQFDDMTILCLRYSRKKRQITEE